LPDCRRRSSSLRGGGGTISPRVFTQYYRQKNRCFINKTSVKPTLYKTGKAAIFAAALTVFAACGAGTNLPELIQAQIYAGDGDVWLAWHEIDSAGDYSVLFNTTNNINTARQAAGPQLSPRKGVITTTVGSLENGLVYYFWIKTAGGLKGGASAALSARPCAAAPITGAITITQGGLYRLPANLKEIDQFEISVDTTEPVTILGNGIPSNPLTSEWATNKGAYINCLQRNTHLILRDIHIADAKMNAPAASTHLINFTGTGNTLTITGRNLMDAFNNMSRGIVKVPNGASLEINGLGTLYFYKNAQHAGIGGAMSGGKCGDITFDGPTIFGKGTKQGAVIGSANSVATTGTIRFISGEYTLIGNAQGAIIGGGAGAASTEGPTVIIEGGTFNFNVDYSGAAIGGGGFSTGNDKFGGTLTVSGGSIRTFIDANAIDPSGNKANGSWVLSQSLWNPVGEPGVNDKAIRTTTKLNSQGSAVYLFAFDTARLGAARRLYTVTLDGKLIYKGGRHGYRFINEDKIKYVDVAQGGQVTINTTLENWDENTDTKLYFYLTGRSHNLRVNETSFNVIWDGANQTFRLN
jgi:hypothetical protein